MAFLVPEAAETERLILRQFTMADIEPVARMIGDAEVQRYLGGPVTKEWEIWGYVARTVGHWTLRGYGPYAVTEKATGAFVGRIGLLNPQGWPGTEIAWTLDRPFWGKGYATEGALAVGRIGFGILKADALVSLIHPENLPSQKVAGRLGAVQDGMSEYFGADNPVRIYRHDPKRF